MFFIAEFIQACSGCGAERVLTPSANTAEEFLIVYFRHLKISVSLYEHVFHADLTFTLGYNMSLSHMLTHFPTLLLRVHSCQYQRHPPPLCLNEKKLLNPYSFVGRTD